MSIYGKNGGKKMCIFLQKEGALKEKNFQLKKKRTRKQNFKIRTGLNSTPTKYKLT